MKPNREAIQNYVLETLGELSQDWDYSRPVGPESLLFSELGLESLDVVVLGTTIQEHYQKQMPFAELLGEIGQRDRKDLSIRELVDFVYAHTNPTATPAMSTEYSG
jgi:acyl carrier protein